MKRPSRLRFSRTMILDRLGLKTTSLIPGLARFDLVEVTVFRPTRKGQDEGGKDQDRRREPCSVAFE